MIDDIRNHSLAETKEIFKEWDVPLYHGPQVFSWLYKKGVCDFREMTNLPQGLRARLKQEFSLGELTLDKMLESFDGTKKFLFRLSDGNFIESVLIPAKGRNTACLSTQAGCKYSCAFCASGLSGFRRNLETWEITQQILEINRRIEKGYVGHVVFMGTGEPLDNYDNVLKAIRIINSKEGLNIGARKITISTAGVIPGIEKLAKEKLQIELSVSLHGADDKTRFALMPINKKYPLKELIETCRKYALATKRQVTFEYVLIKDVNSSIDAADNLIRLLKGWESKVNLIIYNTIKEFSYLPPDKPEVFSFANRIKKSGIPITIRASRGQDIQGACGQLRMGKN